MPEYRVDFSIMVRGDGDDDFIEYGFGSTMAHRSIAAAVDEAHAAGQTGCYDLTGEEATDV